MNVKAAEIQRFPATISHFPALFDQSSFIIQMSLGVFRAKFPMKMKAAKFCFDVYFAYFSTWNFICQICGLIRQAKRRSKIPIFSTVIWQTLYAKMYQKYSIRFLYPFTIHIKHKNPSTDQHQLQQTSEKGLAFKLHHKNCPFIASRLFKETVISLYENSKAKKSKEPGRMQQNNWIITFRFGEGSTTTIEFFSISLTFSHL
jgi:hypothetical protein